MVTRSTYQIRRYQLDKPVEELLKVSGADLSNGGDLEEL
jgi:hypothetical protein